MLATFSAAGSAASTSGQPVTFTATVSAVAPATLTPSTGAVSFTADGDPITGCATEAVTAGTATCDGSALPIGLTDSR